MQVFNEINARNMEDLNVFRARVRARSRGCRWLTRRTVWAQGLLGNRIFCGIIVLTCVAQYCIVSFAGDFAQTVALNWQAR